MERKSIAISWEENRVLTQCFFRNTWKYMKAKRELLWAGQKAASFQSYCTWPSFTESRELFLRLKTVQHSGEIAHGVHIFFCEPNWWRQGAELHTWKKANTSSSSWKKQAVVLILIRKNLHVGCEQEFNMSNVCWRKQESQLVVMDTKRMMLTRF